MSIIKNSNMIRAKAKDPYDYESGWGYLKVTMPLNHPSSNSFVLQFLQRRIHQFSIREQILSSSPLYRQDVRSLITKSFFFSFFNSITGSNNPSKVFILLFIF